VTTVQRLTARRQIRKFLRPSTVANSILFMGEASTSQAGSKPHAGRRFRAYFSVSRLAITLPEKFANKERGVNVSDGDLKLPSTTPESLLLSNKADEE